MFDPQKVGEQADKMIQELNQQLVAEDQQNESSAIAQDTSAYEDQGAESESLSNEGSSVDAAVAELRKQLEAADQRWRVLQGMIAKKDEELEALRTLFAQMHAGDTAQKEPSNTQDLVTSDDIKEYGEDLVDFVRRVSKSVVLAELANFKSDIETKLNTVEQVTTRTAQEQFFDALTNYVPDWRTLNTDPGFLAWLEEVDEFSGATKMQLLQHAVANGDAARAAKFFLTYKEPTSSEGQTTTNPSRKVEKFVSPGRAKATAPKLDSSKRTWTRTEISKLYADKLAGRLSAKEADELERDIFAAQREGRIVA